LILDHLTIKMIKLSSSQEIPWAFLIITYGFSWSFWIPCALLGWNFNEIPASVLFYLGGLGPPLAGILLVYVTRGKDGHRDYWRRVFEVKRIGLIWYAVILLATPILTSLALLGDILGGGSWSQYETVTPFIAKPWSLIPSLALTLLFGPLPEEMGWRGYALDRLQTQHNALIASLILGLIWAIWHLPLFFIAGTYQNGLGVGTRAFWLFMAAIIPESILITWLYNNTKRSILAAVLFHTMINFTGELFTLSGRAEIVFVLLLYITTAVVTKIWGYRTLTIRGKNRIQQTTPNNTPMNTTIGV
jgi:membrane protease YdiL (CAAX protease family)